MKIALSENIALLLHPQYTFRAVWLFRDLTLHGKLCLRNDNNAAFVCIISTPLAMTGEHRKHHTMHAHNKI